MEKKAIKLNYRSAERFSKAYALLERGKIFLPSKAPLPLETTLTLNFTVPQIDNVFSVTGVVVNTLDEQTAAQINKPTGMLLEVVGGPDSIIAELQSTLSKNENYRNLLGLAEPAEISPPSPDMDTAEGQPSPNKTEAPLAAAAPVVPTATISDQTDSELKDQDEVSPEECGKANLSLDWLRKAVA
ncbi:MAG: hypothetical protein PVI82_08705, partial [Desulfobacterales bacterium]